MSITKAEIFMCDKCGKPLETIDRFIQNKGSEALEKVRKQYNGDLCKSCKKTTKTPHLSACRKWKR